MEFSLDRDVLAETVSWVARSIPPRPAVPVLAGLRLETKNNILEISSFDYDVSARITVPLLSLTTPGSVIIDGKTFAEISRSLPPSLKQVTFRTDQSVLLLDAGSFHSQFPTMPGEEYPNLPNFPNILGTIDAQVFDNTVSQVSIAASKDDTLPLLTSVRMELRDNLLALYATDRYRLALKEIPWSEVNVNGLETDVLVKAKILSEIAKNIASTGEISIGLDPDNPSLIGFSAGGRYITSQLNDGQYPDVRSLFPKDVLIYAVVDRNALLEAVKRVSIMAAHNSQISLSFSQGNLKLESGLGEDKLAYEDMPAHLFGEDIEVIFNSNYLQDGLKSLSSTYVRLSFTQASSPVVFTAQSEIDVDDDQQYKYLLMPVRVGM